MPTTTPVWTAPLLKQILFEAFTELAKDKALLVKDFDSFDARMTAVWKRMSGKPCAAMQGSSFGAFRLLSRKPPTDELIRCVAPKGLLHEMARGHERLSILYFRELGRAMPAAIIAAASVHGIEIRNDSLSPRSLGISVKAEVEAEEQVEGQERLRPKEDGEEVHIMKVEYSWERPEQVAPEALDAAPATDLDDERESATLSPRTSEGRVKKEEGGCDGAVQDTERDLEGVHIMKVEY
ncbi:hypothetical protein Q7P37_009600 [Cladosporium fusiforme]